MIIVTALAKDLIRFSPDLKQKNTLLNKSEKRYDQQHVHRDRGVDVHWTGPAAKKTLAKNRVR